MNLPPEAGHRPSLRGVHARGRIDGLMLDMALEQTFANAGTEPLEVIYTFPVPLAATLLGLDVDIGGRKLAAQVLSRRRAEGVYEGAVASGDSAVMVESAGDGRYTLNLGNLLPGDTLRVTVRYGQLLRFEQGIIRVTLPTTLGTWYGDPIRDGGLAPHQVPLTGGLDDYPFSIELAVSGPLAAAQAECTTHTLSIERGEARLQASLRARAWLDRDFVFTLSGLPDGSSAVRVPDFAAAHGEPAAEVVIASLCPRFGDARPAAINLKLLADCSGSMEG
ncbi:VIT domain-containing protein, partial [Methyloversatilis sp. XJ19-13]|uniref:VIT domain-containing protein n=1 Tax=Methyloversatilis sp. XJ19-13 TaxID=2963430 RepID=UPI00211D111E